MLFAELNGQQAAVDYRVVHVAGIFAGVALEGVLAERNHFASASLIGLENDLETRLGASNNDGRPLVLLPCGENWSVAPPEEMITRFETEEGWSQLSVLTHGKTEETGLEILGGGTESFRVIGGDPQSDFVLILSELPQGICPPIRVLAHLPGTRVGGLNPFFSAIGAEPVALMDDVEPLTTKMADKGESCVGVLSRAGAFLWDLDLRGREGLERLASVRVDEDVVVPITAGMDDDRCVELSSDLDALLPRARSGDLDVAFIMNPPQMPVRGAHHGGDFDLAHLISLPLPFGLTL